MNRRQLRSAAGLAGMALVTVTACGGGSGASNSSPKGAVIGLLQGFKDKKAAEVCKYTYAGPSVTTQQCITQVAAALKTGSFTGSYKIGNVSVSGDKALVAVTGKFSFLGQTIDNSDPNAGLPSGSTTFTDAYGQANESSDNSPTVPLVKINGKWLVNQTSS